jgi:hypothetical protein
MVQRGEDTRLSLESCQPVPIIDEGWRQDLDGDIAPEFGVAGAENLAHSTGTEWRDDFIDAKSGPGRDCHIRWSL